MAGRAVLRAFFFALSLSLFRFLHARFATSSLSTFFAFFWLVPLSTWSRTLRRVYLRALALPVLRYLTLCYACTVCDRRRWIHVLWSQHQRAGAAIRFISRLCTGLRCVDQCWHAAEPSTNLYVAPNLWCSRCTVLATVCNVHSMSSLSSDGVQVVCVGRGDRAGRAVQLQPPPLQGRWVGFGILGALGA